MTYWVLFNIELKQCLIKRLRVPYVIMQSIRRRFGEYSRRRGDDLLQIDAPMYYKLQKMKRDKAEYYSLLLEIMEYKITRLERNIYA